ncbi:MAG: UDP-N-acetylmuramoyl-L-alanine--D-glutamate ligase [Sphaerochaetaceae bacterium]|nr:UDP-N-acetylmuramoyl-L-alanine--D-glutamate ligase [Sphaerochaetaceae bacterium]
MRVLGKGKTAQAIKEVYPKVNLYDDGDKSIYDINSHEDTIVSPGIPPSNYLVKNTKNILSDYDLFLDEKKFSIWISGTNGKTTTTQMMNHLLNSDGFECGGNIGTPLAQISNKDKLILETSSFTLYYTNKVKPNIYILLPISDDHVSWHGSFKDYEEAKLKPLSMMKKEDIAIVPNKYKDIKSDAKIYFYKDSEDLAKQFEIDNSKIKFNEPFLLDSLLALCTQKLVGKTIDYERINSFKVDEHKVEEFYDNQNRLWVDDSKATNVDASIWALKAYVNKRIYLILGGDDKGADLTPLFDELKNYNVKIYNIGTNTKRLNNLASENIIEFESCETLNVAVEKIAQKHDNNSVAMLSPAAASLDQFSSYKQRGKEFKHLVFNLRKF